MTEAVVGFFFDEAEARSFVDAMRGCQNALSPEDYSSISCSSRKIDAFPDERVSQPFASRTGLDKQETKPGGLRLLPVPDEKDVAQILAIHFSDPAAFALRVEVGEELVDNFRDQGFEGLVPSELLA